MTWERVTDGDPCGFCAMLAGRGAVYRNQGTADFRPHDHCGCMPAPRFQGQTPSDDTLRWREVYEELATGKGAQRSKNFVNAYERARRRSA